MLHSGSRSPGASPSLPVMVAPLAILLGMPFPAGLRIVGVEAPALVPWAWGVNGFFTVIGSVLAMIVGMVSGFTTVLVVGGACYVGLSLDRLLSTLAGVCRDCVRATTPVDARSNSVKTPLTGTQTPDLHTITASAGVPSL